MDDRKVFDRKAGNVFTGVLDNNDRYSKLILLRRELLDYDASSDKLRRLIANVEGEIYVSNEKIKSLLDTNQKRLDLLMDARNRLEYFESKKLSCFEEYVSVLPDNMIRSVLFNDTLFNNDNNEENEKCNDGSDIDVSCDDNK